jgi:hypothetical protein
MLSFLNNPKDQRRRSVGSFRLLAQEIVDNHKAALEQFREIAPGLAPKEKNLNT